MATQRASTRGGAPRCDFSHAPGSASDWPTAGTDSRCEGDRAPGRKGRPHGGLGRGAGLRGATLLSHLEAQVTGLQRERTPSAKRNHAPGSASDWPTAGTDSRCEGDRAPGRKGRPHGGLGRGAGLRGATLLSHLEAQVTGLQRERTPSAKRNHAPGSASDWPTAGTDSRCEEESRTWKRGMTRATGRGEKI